MKSKWTFLSCILLVISIVPWQSLFTQGTSVENKLWAAAQDISTAMKEIAPDMQASSITIDSPVTFTDGKNPPIIYHCLETIRLHKPPKLPAGIDKSAIRLIIDLSSADHSQAYTINEQPAILCQKGPRAYLCWSLSSKYSFVIEYTPGTVGEEEIFTMAESLILP